MRGSTVGRPPVLFICSPGKRDTPSPLPSPYPRGLLPPRAVPTPDKPHLDQAPIVSPWLLSRLL